MSVKTKPVSFQFSLPVVDVKQIINDRVKSFKTLTILVKVNLKKIVAQLKSRILSLFALITSFKKSPSPAWSGANLPSTPTSNKRFQLKRLDAFKLVRKEKRAGNGDLKNQLKRLEDTPWFSLKKIRKFGLLGLLLLVVVVGGARILGSSSTPETQKVEVLGAKATQDLNKEFLFPLTNSNGEEISNLKYVIQAAELRDEIVVKGQKATAIEGRVFLILSLKITNEHSEAINMNTRDYIRLSINGNENEWLAPDIHNDPVEIQAISTKNTRVGFPISDTDEKLVIRVGEINGEKENISLELK